MCRCRRRNEPEAGDRRRAWTSASVAICSSDTRLYAETTAATLQRRFDQLTDPTAHALISGIRQRQGDKAALLAADLFAQRRAERLTTAGA